MSEYAIIEIKDNGYWINNHDQFERGYNPFSADLKKKHRCLDF